MNGQSIWTRLREWRPGGLVKGTLAMTFGLGLRTLGQGIVFLLVARVLGVQEYGAYVAVLALANALSCFGGMGAQTLIMRDIARNSDFGDTWGRALLAIGLSSPLLLGLYFILAWAVLPAGISVFVVVSIGIADLIFAPALLAAINAYQGHERLGRASRLVVIPVLPRFVGALALVPLTALLPSEARLDTWALLYAVSAFVATFYAMRLVRRELGGAVMPALSGTLHVFRDGWPFAIGSAAQRLYTDIDKTMLARMSTLEYAGAYSAAYRVVDMAAVPLNAMLAAAVPRFFRAGTAGSRSAMAYALRVLPWPVLYALGIGALLYAMAWLMPLLLGADYAEAVLALHWLAWFPLISTPRLFFQAALGASGRQRLVVMVAVMGAVLNILLNVVFIPRWGWLGAVFATYAAETLMLVLMVCFFVSRKSREAV